VNRNTGKKLIIKVNGKRKTYLVPIKRNMLSVQKKMEIWSGPGETGTT
jgi:hypothetical protein